MVTELVKFKIVKGRICKKILHIPKTLGHVDTVVQNGRIDGAVLNL